MCMFPKDFHTATYEMITRPVILTKLMVLILNGNSGEGVRSNLLFFLLKALMRSKAFRYFSSEKTYFPSCKRNMH